MIIKEGWYLIRHLFYQGFCCNIFFKPGRCVWLVLDVSEILRRRTQLRTEEKGEEEAAALENRN